VECGDQRILRRLGEVVRVTSFTPRTHTYIYTSAQISGCPAVDPCGAFFLVVPIHRTT